MSDFRDRTVGGISWSVASQVGRHGVLAITTVVLANLLAPRQFGLIAMITIFTRFAEVITELGFGAALVQRKDIEERHLSSVFWLNLGTGLVVTALLMVCAPYVAAFYREPILEPVTAVVAVTFLLNAAGIVPRTIFTRDIDFRTIAIVETWAAVVGGASAIGMALYGLGVWALVGQEVIRAGATTVLFWGYSTWRPAWRWSTAAIRELASFSLNLMGNRTINYWSRQVDDLLIGRYIGSDALGSYRMAYDIMLFPLRNVSRVISRVMFPSLSEIQDRPAKVKGVFLAVTRAIALVTFPLMLGLLVTTRPFVLSVFGKQWLEMVPILQVLATVGLVQSIGTLNGNLFMSQGRTALQFRLGLIVKGIRIAAIVVGLRWGVMGVAIAYAISVWLTSLPTFYYACGLVDLSLGELTRNLLPVFGVGTTMAIIVYAGAWALPMEWSSGVRLTLLVVGGGIAYGGLVVGLNLRAYREVRDLLVERMA